MKSVASKYAEKAKAPVDFVQVLRDELVGRCRANPRYSLRGFARSLGMDPSTLAKILNGKRPVGARMTVKLGAKLGLSSDVLAGLVNPGASDDYSQLALDAFAIIAGWEHFAILELLRVDGFRPSERAIARSLGLSQPAARAAVTRLVRAGLLRIEADGSWTDLSADSRSTNVTKDAASTAHRRLQTEILQGAIRALEGTPIELRDQSAMTMAIDTERLPEARERIKRFRRGLAKFLSRGPKRDQVYQMSLSLYPCSQISKEEF